MLDSFSYKSYNNLIVTRLPNHGEKSRGVRYWGYFLINREYIFHRTRHTWQLLTHSTISIAPGFSLKQNLIQFAERQEVLKICSYNFIPLLESRNQRPLKIMTSMSCLIIDLQSRQFIYKFAIHGAWLLWFVISSF